MKNLYLICLILVLSITISVAIKEKVSVDHSNHDHHRHQQEEEEKGSELPKIQVGRDGLNQSLYWGTYRPHLYHGMKSRSTKPINTGLIWSVPNVDNLFTRFIHKTAQGSDGVNQYEWVRHDGRNYGEQVIHDVAGNLKLTISFVKSKDGQDWTVRVSGKQLNTTKPTPMASIYYYVQDESIEQSSRNTLAIQGDLINGAQNNGLKGDVLINGNHPEIGKYTLVANDVSESTIVKHGPFLKSHPPLDRWHFYGQSRYDQDNWDVLPSVLDEDVKKHVSPYYSEWYQQTQASNQKMNPPPLMVPTLPNILKEKCNTILLQRVFKVPFDVEYTFITHKSPSKENFENLSNENIKDLSKLITKVSFDKLWSEYNVKFEERFTQKIPLHKYIPIDYHKFTKVALSNLLGGIGYWYGSSISQNNKGEQYLLPPVTLFSATPSRTAFPRGFLWDEGFHQLVISQWDVSLTIESISHWLNVMNKDGWIPREQILGREALSMVPPEFQVQLPKIANPPTLIMAVNRLLVMLEKYNSGEQHVLTKEEADRIKVFIKEAFPRLERFYQYYWDTQSSRLENGFRWRGRKIGHTLASGLDDYPRATPPTAAEVHIDLSSWVAFAAEKMAHFAKHLGHDNSRYLKDRANIVSLIEQYHYDESAHLYHDMVYHSATNNSQVYTNGYMNYFPFMLGLIDPDSPRLDKHLNSLKDIFGLWSRGGIRSLSVKDPNYGTAENYWRGPIWVNINYLMLESLHNKYTKVGKNKVAFADVYHSLRHNLVDNIYSVYRETGFLWEQYHPIECNGQRNHPFSGWTSLVVLMISEQF